MIVLHHSKYTIPQYRCITVDGDRRELWVSHMIHKGKVSSSYQTFEECKFVTDKDVILFFGRKGDITTRGHIPYQMPD